MIAQEVVTMGRKSGVLLVWLLAIAGLVVPLSIGTVALTASSAFAGPAVTCGKYKGSIPLNAAAVAHCTDTANTGGSGSVAIGGNLVSGVWRINWATGPGNSSYAMVTVTPVPTPAQCPKGTAYEDQISGRVTDFTGTADSIPIGDTVSATVCVKKSGKYKEAPHTKFMI
jgi:hypothetical protein